ncbi:hypothetical protein BDF22DRAFT_677073 [Syncephalis plumigaleata]|nr:hypothetical protein BDF22DRAFT_677073 [Syncephalis plumigaleata]
MLSHYSTAVMTVALVIVAALTFQSTDAQPVGPMGYGIYNTGCYPCGYSACDPYCYGGYYGGYYDNYYGVIHVTTAFNSHQNEADHIANSDVDAFTTANNVCANDNFVNSDYHSVVG